MSSDDDKKWYCDFSYKNDNQISLFELKSFRKDSKFQADLRKLITERVEAHLNSSETPVTPLHIIHLYEQAEKAAKSLPSIVEQAGGEVRARKTSVIEHPPGHHLIRVLQMFLPKSAYQRTFGQMVADAREEYYEALKDGDEAESKKIKRMLIWDMLMCIGTYIAELPAHLVTAPFRKLFDKGE